MSRSSDKLERCPVIDWNGGKDGSGDGPLSEMVVLSSVVSIDLMLM